jgi:hypothetical protein
VSRRNLELAMAWVPPPAPKYLAPGDGHPEAAPLVEGNAPYTANKCRDGGNYERDASGLLVTKSLAGEIDQFRAGDIEQGLAYRQPL